MSSQPIPRIAYYRVSTKQHGQSGLGLEAQHTQVSSFVGSLGRFLREFVEVESGKQNARPRLTQALAYAKAAATNQDRTVNQSKQSESNSAD